MTQFSAAHGSNQREWVRFALNKPATLVSVNHGLHGVSTRNCKVINISIGGAGIQVITTIGLPDHYYLCFLRLDDKLGVAEVYRSSTKIGLKFIKLLDEHFLARILRG